MDALKNEAPSGTYEVTKFTCHTSRPGFRIVELTLNSAQQVPWHYHSNFLRFGGTTPNLLA